MKMESKLSTITTLHCCCSIFFFFFCLVSLSLFPTNVGAGIRVEVENSSSSVPVNVGVVFGHGSLVGEMCFTCIQMALSDFYASHAHYRTRLVLHTRDSDQDIVGAAAAALYLMEKVGVKAILGTLTSMEAEFVIDMGTKAQIPIISYSATSPRLSSTGPSYFIRAAQDDSTQLQAIGALVKAFGWREVVPISVDNDCEGIIPHLVDTLQQINVRIPYRSVISTFANDDQILKELYKLKTMQTRVFIVHMSAKIGSRLFSNAKEAGMMSEGYVWIMTTGISNSLEELDPGAIEAMQGVLGVKSYVPKTKQLDHFTNRWQVKFQEDNLNMPKTVKINILCLWAYDAASALARAVEDVGDVNSVFLNTDRSSNSIDLDNIRASPIGPKLLQAVSSTKIKGLSGDFSLLGGRLQSSTYQIVNVIGNGCKEIGFWTPERGLTRELNIRYYPDNLKPNLSAIIWPGYASSSPKGWVIPTTGKKLRILVPKRSGFEEFVKVVRDPVTNTTEVTGYCIDVFETVMAKLPYYVPFEYVPFVNPDWTHTPSYEDMIDQVYFQNYDAVVGDITIIANRSLYVDFTQPYSVSGVAMVVPIKDTKKKNAWTFLKPLTRDLWVTTFGFFIFIAFVVWFLEHRNNEEFRGPPLHQVGTSLYYSFITMVFAHRENVVSNLTRFVMVVWMFVVLIITQIYTASLTSMLTVQQLQPIVTDLNELIRNGEYVGYQAGTFVEGLLKKLGFHESKLRSYSNPAQLDEQLSNGSANGGIAAVFDEIPYMNLFLAKYCSKYTMVQPTYKTGGFGFVFPAGSPLVSDVSKAILSVTEGDKMLAIEKKWIVQQDTCLGGNNVATTASLGLDSFWGLFLIAGTASFLALCIFIVIFLYEQRNILTYPDTSIWTKIRILARVFDEKDLKFHTFRKTEQQQGRNGDTPSVHARNAEAVETAPNTDWPPSPSTYSPNTNENSVSSSEGGSPLPDHMPPASDTHATN